MKLIGQLTDVFAPETKPNFSKKEFWIKQPDTERHPQHWKLELHGDDIKALNGKKVGDWLECEVEIRGRKFKRRDGSGEDIFITLKCVGMRTLEALEVPGFKAKVKPGREADEDRKKAQGDLDF